MPSKELGDKIRALLEANPGCEVVVRTNGGYIAYINDWYDESTSTAKCSVFHGGCFTGDCNGQDEWGHDGRYFQGKPSQWYDLVEVCGVAS